MKCLVECEIENLGGDSRGVRFVMDDHGKTRSYAEVKASACRMPDGSPVAEDWPPMLDEAGRYCWLPGLVEAEVVTPFLIALDFPGDQRAHARPEAVRLAGTNGRPAYRLVVVGELDGAINHERGCLMRRLDELNSPNSCINKARDDEMVFVLLARDKAAPVAIRAWIAERIRIGKNQPGDALMLDAELCARDMEADQ